MTLMAPGKRLAIYSCTVEGGCLPGWGPLRLDFEIRPFPLATSKCLPFGVTRTQVGYQPTGINPSERLRPGSETSNTETALMLAFATNSVRSSGDSARLFGVDPGGDRGSNSAISVSTTLPLSVSRTVTVLRLAFATKSSLPPCASSISFG